MEGIVMEECEIPTKYTLPDPVFPIRLEEPSPDFSRARRRATRLAQYYHSNARLLSWFDRTAEVYFPHYFGPCRAGKPSWVEYAKFHGANLTVDINDEDYVFVYQI
jgi:hypothetical protein